jgi:hypothetical protein
LNQDAEGWGGVLPPLPEGLYEVSLEAFGVPAVDSVYASADLALVPVEERQPDAEVVP